MFVCVCVFQNDRERGATTDYIKDSGICKKMLTLLSTYITECQDTVPSPENILSLPKDGSLDNLCRLTTTHTYKYTASDHRLDGYAWKYNS